MTRSVNKMLPILQAALEKQPIVKAWLFGSYSRVSLMTISRIMVALSDAVGKKVDLVEEGRLLPFAQESVEKDKILIYERAS